MGVGRTSLGLRTILSMNNINLSGEPTLATNAVTLHEHLPYLTHLASFYFNVMNVNNVAMLVLVDPPITWSAVLSSIYSWGQNWQCALS